METEEIRNVRRIQRENYEEYCASVAKVNEGRIMLDLPEILELSLPEYVYDQSIKAYKKLKGEKREQVKDEINKGITEAKKAVLMGDGDELCGVRGCLVLTWSEYLEQAELFRFTYLKDGYSGSYGRV